MTRALPGLDWPPPLWDTMHFEPLVRRLAPAEQPWETRGQGQGQGSPYCPAQPGSGEGFILWGRAGPSVRVSRGLVPHEHGAVVHEPQPSIAGPAFLGPWTQERSRPLPEPIPFPAPLKLAGSFPAPPAVTQRPAARPGRMFPLDSGPAAAPQGCGSSRWAEPHPAPLPAQPRGVPGPTAPSQAAV